MTRFGRFGMGFSLGAAALLAGCHSQSTPPQSTLAPTAQGVTCTKCQVTWVKVPVGSGGKQGAIQAYTWGKRDVCPDCRGAVDNFFTTGKLEHTCKTCGTSMEICETH